MIHKFLISVFFLFSTSLYAQTFKLPINSYNREEISFIQLTQIGKFGKLRKSRSGIPAHLHTGIDIKRPNQNYYDEPIYSIGEGMIISVRDDGPFALIIIEHNLNGKLFWSEYEHVAGIKVMVGDWVDQNTQIARFMNKSELNKYGWQFDHFHFEILKIPPQKVKLRKNLPQYFYKPYNLICYNFEDLMLRYYNPLDFLNKLINN
jgi:murein DD-endopeptidase MepM/ murein hydrolase activator NlpD